MSKRRSGSKGTPRSIVAVTAPDAAFNDDIMIIEDDNDDGIPSTQPVDDRVLKDVVAYVEVRSNTENRSRSVSKQLQLLGAVVVSKFSPEVTHVIWKEGKKSIKDKAVKKGLHLVSVLWVDSCKQNQEHVAESLFPVHDPADGSPLMIAKLKRVKSMQPKSLEEDLVDGIFKKRRRKRKMRAEDFEPLWLKTAQNASPSVAPLSFQTASPSIPRSRVLVEDTQQPMSPLRRIVGPDLTPTISLIPNTPDSMRRALDTLTKRKLGTPTGSIFSSAEDQDLSSPTTKLSTPMSSKKLFTTSAPSVSSDTDSTITGASSRLPVTSTNNATDSSDSEKEQRPSKRQRMSSGSKRQRKSAEKKKRKVLFGKTSTTETDSADAAVRNSKGKGRRASELTKAKKGRRSSNRVQRRSAESKEGESEEINHILQTETDGVSTALSNSKTKAARVSELSKEKKGRRSSGRFQRQSAESKTQESAEKSTRQVLPQEVPQISQTETEGVDAVVDKSKTKASRVSELSKEKKGRRSSGRFQRQSAESKTQESAEKSTRQVLPQKVPQIWQTETEGVDAIVSKSKKESRVSELANVKKGRRSSGRFQKQSAESKTQKSTEKSTTQPLSEELSQNAVVRDSKTKGSRVSELSNVNKSRRTSGRLQRRSEESKDESVSSTENHNPNSEDTIRCNESYDDSTIRPQRRRKSVAKVLNENTTDSVSSETLCQDDSSSTVTEGTDTFTDVSTSTATTTKRRRRKLMSLSTQGEPPEALIIPSQSVYNTLVNDSLYGVGEGDGKGSVSQKDKRKGSGGRQKSVAAVSSRKKKKLISTSEESENEPPEGSQELTSSQIALIPTSRKSLEEFKPQRSTRKKTQSASQAKKHRTNALSEINSASTGSEEDTDTSSVSVSSRTSRRQKSSKADRNGSHLETSMESDDSTLETRKPKKRVRITSQSAHKSRKSKPTMVMTSMHAKDQELVLSVAKSLKHFKVVDTVSDSTTHVVCGNNRRTLNVLSAIARGCWLLSIEWVLNSVEAGHWLPEEPYEIHDYFPAAKISRLERVKAGASYHQDLFAPPGSIYIIDESSPPKERLVELVELCGGQVAHSLNDAMLCVGDVKRKNKDVPVVAELWVLDCITQHCQLPLEPYFLPD